MRRRLALVAVTALTATLAAAPAFADRGDRGHSDDDRRGKKGDRGAQVYRVDLDELNDTDVDGEAYLVRRGDRLHVVLHAEGLEPGQVHMQHIHGHPDKPATCPPEKAAGDDGLLSFADGLPYYGPVVLGLEPYPFVGKNGKIRFQHAYDIGEIADLKRLTDEVIVLHGLTVNGTYDRSVPVACGEIEKR